MRHWVACAATSGWPSHCAPSRYLVDGFSYPEIARGIADAT